MDEDQLFLRPPCRPSVGISEDAYRHADDMELIKALLTQLPTRREVWRAAMLGMLGGAVAAVTLIGVDDTERTRRAIAGAEGKRLTYRRTRSQAAAQEEIPFP